MSPRGVLVVGCGRRVREAVLPAFARARELFAIRHVAARSAREIDAGGKRYAVESLAALGPRAFEGVDLVYVAVGKGNVPSVLRTLAELGGARVDLLLDTPVLLPKHLRWLGLLESFRRVETPEDCIALPTLDLVGRLVDAGVLGEPRSVRFDGSAYAYHGVAMAKTALRAARVTSASRRRLDGSRVERRLRFAGGKEAAIVEPRDYATGRFVVRGEKRAVADGPDVEAGALVMERMIERNRCVGFRAGDLSMHLDDDEIELLADAPMGPFLTSQMEGLKRVGLLRLLRRVARGEPTYPVLDALEDTLVDFALAKAGRYVATPFTSIHAAPARWLFGVVSRVAGR